MQALHVWVCGVKVDEHQQRADKNHRRGFVSSLLGCVGGIVGEPSAVKAFMMWQKLIRVSAKSGPDVTFGAVNEDCGLRVYRLPRSPGGCVLWIYEEFISDTHYLQYAIYYPKLFFSTWPMPPPTSHWQAVTHIPVVTVNRTGAVFADRPWTLWRDVWLCGNARLVTAQFQTVTL